MSGELKNKNNPSDAEQTINRRNLLLGTSSIVAAVTLTSEALAQAQKQRPLPRRQQLSQQEASPTSS